MFACSISEFKITAAAVNKTGEWLAFGSSKLGQLLVWEWQSETCTSSLVCILIRGHFLTCLSQQMC